MSAVANNQTAERIVHVAGPRPTLGQLLRELRDVAARVAAVRHRAAGEALASPLGRDGR